MKAFILGMTVLTVQSIRLNLGIDQHATQSLSAIEDIKHHNIDMIGLKSALGIEEIPEIPDPKTLLMVNRDTGMALDIGGRLYEAMKNTSSDNLNLTQFKQIVRQWYYEHGKPMDSDMDNSLNVVFSHIDTDNSTTIDKEEIFQFLFAYMDTNGDGVWNMTEITDFVRDYAKLLHRNLTGDWLQSLQRGYDEVNRGVSAHELQLALSRHNRTIATFKDFVMSSSVPLPKEKLDTFLIMEEIFKAIERANNSLSEEQFVEVVRRYMTSLHHRWNRTVDEGVRQFFNTVDEDNSTTVTKRELFNAIFKWFDSNGDNRLSDKEIHDFYVSYARQLNRTLKTGWWNDTVQPAIRVIEAGVTPDELWQFLQKNNASITDFRNAVIALSHPSGGSDNHDDEEPNDEDVEIPAENEIKGIGE